MKLENLEHRQWRLISARKCSNFKCRYYVNITPHPLWYSDFLSSGILQLRSAVHGTLQHNECDIGYGYFYSTVFNLALITRFNVIFQRHHWYSCFRQMITSSFWHKTLWDHVNRFAQNHIANKCSHGLINGIRKHTLFWSKRFIKTWSRVFLNFSNFNDLWWEFLYNRPQFLFPDSWSATIFRETACAISHDVFK